MSDPTALRLRGRPIRPRPSRPLDQLARDYLAGRRRRGEIAASTARGNIWVLRRFADAVGDRPDPVAVGRWLEELGRLAPRSRRHAISITAGFTAWLADEGHLHADPLADPPKVKIPRSVPRALPADQVADVVAACPDSRARLIVDLMLWCGLRRAEVPALRVDDVDRTAGTIRVRGKGGHERLVPLPAAVAAALDAYLTQWPAPDPRGPLVRSWQHQTAGISAVRVGMIVTAAMTAAGVKRSPGDGRSPHALRHTAATDTLRAGATLADVQALLGHASIATTAVYLKADTAALARVMANRRYG